MKQNRNVLQWRYKTGKAAIGLAPKYEWLASELRQQCTVLRRQGLTKLPGEWELCTQYHVSRETARHALDLLEREGLVVRMRGSGTYLSKNGGVRIAAVTVSVERYLYPQLLREVEKSVSAEGFRLESYASDSRVTEERAILERLLVEPPAGILLEPARSALPSPNLDLLARLEAQGVPLVFLHAALPVPEAAPCVRDDNAGGARLLTRRLLDMGHRRIAAIFKSDDRQGLERYGGFVSALCQAGCPVEEDSVLWFDSVRREDLLDGQDAWLHEFIRGRLRGCTAVICYNDEIAFSLIRCLLAEGRRVPEDVAVVSFDNSHYCRSGPVSITSLSHEGGSVGRTAAAMLLDLIRGRSVRSVSLPWTLRERASG